MTNFSQIDTTGWTIDDFIESRLKENLKSVQPGDELGIRRARILSEEQAEYWFHFVQLNKGIYVVCAGNGIGEFLWYKEDDSPIPTCGSFVCGLMDYYDYNQYIMSQELFDDFFSWARLYLESAPPCYVYEENVRSFDWDSFNETGLQLARRLKLGLGPDVRVRYVRPSEDPGRIRLEFTEM